MNNVNNKAKQSVLHLLVSYRTRNIAEVFGEGEARKFSNDLNDFLIRCRSEDGAIAEAVYPMFDDIADRDRQIFGQDVILDTGKKDNPNCTEHVTLAVAKVLHWHTEGTDLEAHLADEANDNASPTLDFTPVTFRYFWCLHSDNLLSYHVALQVGYWNSFADYYALSALQKVFFPSEQSLDPAHAFNAMVHVKIGGTTIALKDFVFERFKEHCYSLAEKCFGNQGDLKALQISPDLIYKTSAGKPHAGHHCQAIFLLEDQLLFKTLKQRDDRRGQSKQVAEQAPPADQKTKLVIANVLDEFKGESNVDSTRTIYRNGKSHGEKADGLSLIFASGFFQNVIDFFRQNSSEVSDGTNYIYEDDDFLLYVNGDSVYEVVQESRSLDAVRANIGICPYLLQVHLMTFHDEALIKQFEDDVKNVVKLLEGKFLEGMDPKEISQADVERMEELEKRFFEFRRTSFEKVDKYLSFNFLRYDTERTFFEEIEKHRGIKERRAYWDEVINRLGGVVGNVREALQRRNERSFNDYLFAIAVFGVLQVLFGASNAWRSIIGAGSGDADTKNTIDYFDGAFIFLTVAGLVVFLAALWPRRKFIGKRISALFGYKHR